MAYFFCPTRFGRRRRKQKAQQVAFQGGNFEEPQYAPEVTHHYPPGCYSVILQDFNAYVADELTVREGGIVQMLYRENDWAFVANLDGEEGYVPFSFCAENHHPPRSNSFRSQSSGGSREPSEQLGRDSRTSSELAPKRIEHSSSMSTGSNHTQQQSSPTTIKASMQSLRATPERIDVRKALKSSTRIVTVDRLGDAGSPPTSDREDGGAPPQGNITTAARRQTTQPFSRHGNESTPVGDHHTTYTEVHVCPKINNEVPSPSADSQAVPFVRKPSGLYLVLYDFRECGEDEIPIGRGEIITMLNDDDSDWAWVAKQDDTQGFVPRNFLCAIGQPAVSEQPEQSNKRTAARQNHVSNGIKAKQRLVVLYDFQAQSVDQLTVFRGDVVVLSRDQCAGYRHADDWIWVYSPDANRSGFIPANFAMPPASQ
ncbi:SH3 domain-containing protein Dlish-like [Corticium candelabrum]|uniref:SH3 domain-containing protein Dlish-like n=1 Tax=Corticium candelabrum TaxID=121492 RepID=UPI002E267566|nr:SH3 domain-containing protein Dlish-like [Corticium candelabrum]